MLMVSAGDKVMLKAKVIRSSRSFLRPRREASKLKKAKEES
jgi:hypothetical protein